jgi:hypothetical protein
VFGNGRNWISEDTIFTFMKIEIPEKVVAVALGNCHVLFLTGISTFNFFNPMKKPIIFLEWEVTLATSRVFLIKE